MKLVIQFMIADTQIVYKLQVHIKFLFTGYKYNRIEALQKVQEYLSTRLLQRSKKVQFVSILIDSTRSIYVLAHR